MKNARLKGQWTSGTGRTLWARERSGWRWILVFLACTVLACVSATLPGAGQQSPRVGLQEPPTSPFPEEMDEMDPQLTHQQLRAMNAERQKELVRDTAKLLKLVTALNTQTQAEDAATLTEEQWKEIDRIQKLARSVKEKMVQTYGGVPVFRPPIGPAIR